MIKEGVEILERKLIFFDIDGTLLDHEKQLPKSTVQAISELKEMGHILAIATGRAPFMFKDIREELGIHTFVSLNGSYVVHEGSLIHHTPLDNEELHRFVPYATNQDHPIIFEHVEEMFITTSEYHPYVDGGMGGFNLREDAIYNPQCYLDQEMYQSVLFCMEKDESFYRETFRKFDFVRFNEYATDVIPSGSSKAKGIEALLQQLRIPLEHVYAFGDGLNDLEMMSFVKNSVAMGNAVDEVKQAAKYVTAPVDEDGIRKGLELVGLLDLNKAAK